MSQLGEALTDPALTPPVDVAGRVGVEPGGGRARPDAGAAGPRARRPAHRRARALPHRHGAVRRRRAAGHDAARAPRRALVVGPPLPDAATSRRSSRSASACRTARSSGGWRPGSGSTTRPSARRTSEMLAEVLAAAPAVDRRRPSCASAGSRRSTSARAPVPHADGGFGTPSGKLELRADAARRAAASTRCRTTTRRPRWPTRSWPRACRWPC